MSTVKSVSNAIKKKGSGLIGDIGAGTMIGMGMNAYFGVSSYNYAREQGHGVGMSAVRGVSETLMADIIGFKAYMGTLAVRGGPKLAVQGFNKLDQQARQMNRQRLNKPFDNATFVDSQQAYTMRQAGMQLAKASKHNLQQGMMGNEASMMHI